MISPRRSRMATISLYSRRVTSTWSLDDRRRAVDVLSFGLDPFDLVFLDFIDRSRLRATPFSNLPIPQRSRARPYRIESICAENHTASLISCNVTLVQCEVI